MIHPDQSNYFKFTSKNRIVKALNALIGLLEGIGIDKKVNAAELAFLREWLCSLEDVVNRHPFTEIIPSINEALSDGVFTEDELEDVLWLCRKMKNVVDGDAPITGDIQILHGILSGILADGIVTEEEVRALSEWIDENDHLRRCYPYDEIDSVLTKVLQDGVVDEKEKDELALLFSEFVPLGDDVTLTNPIVLDNKGKVSGLCAVCPDVDFVNSVFCFTGESSRFKRNELVGIVSDLGGECIDRISKKIDYLVIATNGNPCWAYACYGRKVEKAVSLRKEGHKIVLLHENDFMDAIQESLQS